ncbi:Proline--tRNA ligase [Lachnellula suecica]|uniref:proline--tRNA ligase n=1 Tax=Lachnellula suecica TaxID=602035 RepID=A0A8T9C1C7_9HELO|nr:Proline--tRNA ligase [Lachnellula suecica]
MGSLNYPRMLEYSPLPFFAAEFYGRASIGDGRVRLSKFWAPSGGISPSAEEDSQAMLIRAGFLRQAHSGIFHMLPLGRRVQDKLESLIDKHMSSLGASKLDLSSISSEALWKQSGRLESVGSELFRFRDRKESGYLLSPTHEEEITSLVSSTTTSYKDLPIRLYQISRKYRDELRPRHGLLRSREFIMKDLYTFDYSSPLALETYNEIREAYARLFDELKIPYLVAEADSGDMGGNLSHEFHFPTAKGEDHIISCSSCEYVANEELADGPALGPEAFNSTDAYTDPLDEVPAITSEEQKILTGLSSFQGISKCRSMLFNVWYSPSSPSASNPPSEAAHGRQVNVYALKAIFSEIDNSIEDPLSFLGGPASSTMEGDALAPQPLSIVNIVDGSVPSSLRQKMRQADHIGDHLLSLIKRPFHVSTMIQDPETDMPFNFLRVQKGDRCPRCSVGHLDIQKAIELGHTFHLGSRYTKQLGGQVTIPKKVIQNQEADFECLSAEKGSDRQVIMQMGCHGIGVSRMIGAVADTLADKKGLIWPRVMAPFEVVIIAGKGLDNAALEIYDIISKGNKINDESNVDLVLDDRSKQFSWKMNDADLVGYPVIVVLGRRWQAEKMCEVQCRRLNIKEDIPLDRLSRYITSLLVQL